MCASSVTREPITDTRTAGFRHTSPMSITFTHTAPPSDTSASVSSHITGIAGLKDDRQAPRSRQTPRKRSENVSPASAICAT